MAVFRSGQELAMQMNIQWSVVWSVLRTLLVAGGPVATLLIALGFPPIQVSEWLGIALALIGVLSVAVPGLLGALTHTDAAKVASVATLPVAAANAAVENLPTTARNEIKLATVPHETLLAAAAALPGVLNIITAPDATDGVATAAADTSQPKIVTQGAKP